MTAGQRRAMSAAWWQRGDDGQRVLQRASSPQHAPGHAAATTQRDACIVPPFCRNCARRPALLCGSASAAAMTPVAVPATKTPRPRLSSHANVAEQTAEKLRAGGVETKSSFALFRPPDQ